MFYKNKVPFTAVDQISFCIKKGECVAIVGESGSGKTTTAKILTQLIHPDSGNVFLGWNRIHFCKRKIEKRILYKDSDGFSNDSRFL